MRFVGCALIVSLLSALPASAQTPLDYKDPSVTTRPKFDPRKSQPPDYPAAAKRAGETGTTKLTLCVNAAGRAENVKLAVSSGSARLDDATIQWTLKGVRFSPAKVGDTAVTVCNFPWQQVWRLAQ